MSNELHTLNLPGQKLVTPLQQKDNVSLDINGVKLAVAGNAASEKNFGLKVTTPGVLLDPVAYKHDQHVGFKGLHDEKNVIVGSLPEHLERLKRFHHLARRLPENQLSLFLSAGKLVLRQLSYTPTRIITGETESNQASQIFESATNFITQHPQIRTILEKSSNPIYRDLLAEKLYYDWYRGDTNSKHLLREMTREEYRSFAERSLAGIHLGISSDDSWLFIQMSETEKLDAGAGPQGRIFFNAQPQFAPRVAGDLLKAVADKGATATALKISANPTRYYQTDSGVLYFNASNTRKVLQSVREVYAAHRQEFFNEIPLFAQQLHTENGIPMQGLAFGQTPSEKKISFGTQRCRALAASMHRIYRPGQRINPAALNASFAKIAPEYGIDPNNPAFNIGGQAAFGVIK